MLAWMAQQDMRRHSERTRSAMAGAKAEGVTLGGRKAGMWDRKPASHAMRSEAVRAVWAGPGGELRRQALADRNRAGGA
jgi:DNA invertase Pin-like site-specific DNA recombinase